MKKKVILVIIALLSAEMVCMYFIQEKREQLSLNEYYLYIADAQYVPADENSENEFGEILVSVQNKSNLICSVFPDIYFGSGKSPEKCYTRVLPAEYYDNIYAAGSADYSYYEVLMPGEISRIAYPLDEDAFNEISSIMDSNGEIYVSMDEIWTRGKCYCTIKIKGGEEK
ncbi:MAG: hypothetical protein ACI4JN_00490 [Ruminococcus sp.]